MKRLISIAVILSIFLMAIPSYGSTQGSTAKVTGKVVVTPKTGVITYPNTITLSAIFVPSKPYDGTLDQSMEWSVTPKSALNYVKVDNGVVTWSANPSKDIKNVKFVAKSVSYKKSAYAKLTLKKGSNEPPAPVESINITPTSKTLEYGDDPFQFNVSSVDGDSYLWSLSNTKYLSVDGSGLVSVLSNPDADQTIYLTVTSTQLKKSTTAKITVKYVDPEAEWTYPELDALADAVPVDPSITAWRDTYNADRSGFEKVSTKFFDVYYHTNDTNAVIAKDAIVKYGDSMYAFFYKVYGKQFPADVYLNKYSGSQYGAEYDQTKKIININTSGSDNGVFFMSGLAHEFGHVFFMSLTSNISNTKDYYTFSNEGIAELSSNIFIHILRKIGVVTFNDVDNDFVWYLQDINKRMVASEYRPTLDQTAERWKQFAFGVSFNTSDNRDYVDLYQYKHFFWYLYSQYGIDKYIELCTSANTSDFKKRLEDVYDKTTSQFTTEYYIRLDKAVNTNTVITKNKTIKVPFDDCLIAF